jgi:hypothetical protein
MRRWSKSRGSCRCQPAHAGARKPCATPMSAEASVSSRHGLVRPPDLAAGGRSSPSSPQHWRRGCSAVGPAPAAPAPRHPAAGSRHQRPPATRVEIPAGLISPSAALFPWCRPEQDTHAHDLPEPASREIPPRRGSGEGHRRRLCLRGRPSQQHFSPASSQVRETAMHFGARSQISGGTGQQRLPQPQRHIQAAVLSQLRAGQSHVRLTGPALRTIRFVR